MAEHKQLRSATLEILEARDERAIGIGALVKSLQRRGYSNLQTLWKELDAMEREHLIQSSGPPARRQISLVAAPAPARSPRPRPVLAPEPVKAPERLLELEDPATFVGTAPEPEPAHDPGPIIAEAAAPVLAPEPAPEAAEPAETAPLIVPTKRRGGRPAPEARTTRFKGLTRCDYPERHMVGYMVRVNWDGQRRQAFFADKKYGDRLAALDAALCWRNSTEAELGKPRTEQQVIGKSASNTGIPGVTRIEREGRQELQVTWYEDGRQRRRRVNIDKLGEAQAIAVAKQIRAEAERRRLGVEAFAQLGRRR